MQPEGSATGHFDTVEEKFDFVHLSHVALT
jgi:hypothetical protein